VSKIVIDLDKIEADLMATRARIDKLRAEIGQAEQYLRDQMELVALAQRLYGTGTSEPAPTAPPPPSPVPSFPVRDTKQAAITILRETSPRAWKVEEITAELQRRGWDPGESTQPRHLLVASALSRLVRSGEWPFITKPKYGYYAWDPGTIWEEAETPEQLLSASKGGES
jgi:hypothetical protein